MAVTIEKIERPDRALVKELGQYATTMLSDAMEKCQTMHAEIKPVYPISSVAGPAVTARSMVADYLTPVAAIDYAQPGDVIVIDVRGYKDAAIWGDLAARSCKLRGIAAVVIDGACRDSQGIKELGVPHFSRAITPNAGDCSVLGDINIPVQCGGVVVNPGDIVVGDMDGCGGGAQGQGQDGHRKGQKAARGREKAAEADGRGRPDLLRGPEARGGRDNPDRGPGRGHRDLLEATQKMFSGPISASGSRSRSSKYG